MTNIGKPLHDYLRQRARLTPEKPAIWFYGREVSYRELDELSDRFAHYLIQNGVTKGDTVALYMQNCPQYIICHFGIQKIGAIVAPCNPMLKEWELEYELNDLCATAIILLDHLYPVVNRIRTKTSLQHVILTHYADFLPDHPAPTFPEPLFPRQKHPATQDLLHILNKPCLPPPRPEMNIQEDVSLIMYTSGTTGLPKGAMLTYRNAEWKTRLCAETYGYREDDVFLAVMPLFHIAGMLLGMNSPVYCGGTIALLSRFAPNSVLYAIEHCGVTVAYTVVPMIVAMLNHPQARNADFRSLRLNPCTSFGIPLTEDISNEWKALTGAGLFEPAYGLSETHTADTLMPPNQVKFGTVGKPPAGTQLKIVSLTNPELEQPLGETGEILVKNEGVFKGYLNKPDATKHTLRNGWVHTGDIGWLDEEGYLYFLGRTKEMIKCSGYSVFPEEVELLLTKHPAVSAAAVIGVPDSLRGETVKAFVVLKPEYKGTITPEDLIYWSKANMADYKYPRSIEFRATLPTTGSGKLLRRLLAEEGKKA